MHFKFGATIAHAMEKLRGPIHADAKPANLVDTDDMTTVFVWRKKYSEWLDMAKHWDIKDSHAFALIYVHCKPKLRET